MQCNIEDHASLESQIVSFLLFDTTMGKKCTTLCTVTEEIMPYWGHNLLLFTI